jgi:hypothetical protein
MIHLLERILVESRDTDLIILYKNGKLYKKPLQLNYKNVTRIQLKHFIDNEFITVTGKPKTFIKAVRENRLDLLLFLFKYIKPFARISCILHEACSLGRYKIVQYLMTLPECQIYDIHYTTSFLKGHLDVFKLLVKFSPITDTKCMETISECAAQTGLSHVKFIERHGILFSKDMLNNAIQCENLDVVKYLHTRCGFPLNIEDLECAVFNTSNVDIIKYLYPFTGCTRKIIESSNTHEIYELLSTTFTSL